MKRIVAFPYYKATVNLEGAEHRSHLLGVMGKVSFNA